MSQTTGRLKSITEDHRRPKYVASAIRIVTVCDITQLYRYFYHSGVSQMFPRKRLETAEMVFCMSCGRYQF